MKSSPYQCVDNTANRMSEPDASSNYSTAVAVPMMVLSDQNEFLPFAGTFLSYFSYGPALTPASLTFEQLPPLLDAWYGAEMGPRVFAAYSALVTSGTIVTQEIEGVMSTATSVLDYIGSDVQAHCSRLRAQRKLASVPNFPQTFDVYFKAPSATTTYYLLLFTHSLLLTTRYLLLTTYC